MPALLLPVALAALLALALPLAIHVARASEQRPTDFAALRWLRERPRPRHRLRFDERLLLAVRLLLLALVALWLARPVLRGAQGGGSWVVAVPGVAPAVARAAVGQGEEGRWLAPGLPGLDRPPSTAAAFPSVLRQLDAELPPATRLTVLVPGVLDGADAERPRLSRAVDWRVVAASAAVATRAPRSAAVPALRGDGRVVGARYLRALATALGARDMAPSSAPLPPTAVPLIWASAGPLSTRVRNWVARGGTLLATSAVSIGDAGAVVRGEDGVALIEARMGGRGRLLRFARPLAPAAMPELLDGGFPALVAAQLAPAVAAPARLTAADYAPETGAPAEQVPARELRPWLAVLIALVALAERWLATSRRREARA